LNWKNILSGQSDSRVISFMVDMLHTAFGSTWLSL
jgi:hypothetical protein